MSSDPLSARWRTWDGTGLEHLVLQQGDNEIVAESVVICRADEPFAVRYRIVCRPDWHAVSVEAEIIGSGARVRLGSDGSGRWTKDGAPQAALNGAIDPDLTVTPFTNTLPIRRLGLAQGESADITAAFVEFPQLAIRPLPQRYTCLEPGRRYLYESRGGAFRREIETDGDGLVVTYPDLWRRA